MSLEYDNGVLEFLEFAFNNAPQRDKLPYPCVRCNNCLLHNRQVMQSHLQNYGIARNYVRWVMHGEYEFDESTNNDDFEDEPYDDMNGLIHDAFGMLLICQKKMKFHIFILVLKNRMMKQKNFTTF